MESETAVMKWEDERDKQTRRERQVLPIKVVSHGVHIRKYLLKTENFERLGRPTTSGSRVKSDCTHVVIHYGLFYLETPSAPILFGNPGMCPA
jgi:hypothetical protein